MLHAPGVRVALRELEGRDVRVKGLDRRGARTEGDGVERHEALGDARAARGVKRDEVAPDLLRLRARVRERLRERIQEVVAVRPQVRREALHLGSVAREALSKRARISLVAQLLLINAVQAACTPTRAAAPSSKVEIGFAVALSAMCC